MQVPRGTDKKTFEHKRRPRDEHQQDGATTTTTTLASSPSVIKASSPFNVRHLRLPPTSMPTSTSSSPRRSPTSEGDTSIFGSPSRDMVEHGIFPSTTATYDDLSDLCHHIESESDFTTSPIYDELPQLPCEESHNPHHLSEMSDSTICEFECTYLEGVSEPPHRVR